MYVYSLDFSKSITILSLLSLFDRIWYIACPFVACCCGYFAVRIFVFYFVLYIYNMVWSISSLSILSRFHENNCYFRYCPSKYTSRCIINEFENISLSHTYKCIDSHSRVPCRTIYLVPISYDKRRSGSRWRSD